MIYYIILIIALVNIFLAGVHTGASDVFDLEFWLWWFAVITMGVPLFVGIFILQRLSIILDTMEENYYLRSWIRWIFLRRLKNLSTERIDVIKQLYENHIKKGSHWMKINFFKSILRANKVNL